MHAVGGACFGGECTSRGRAEGLESVSGRSGSACETSQFFSILGGSGQSKREEVVGNREKYGLGRWVSFVSGAR